MNFLDNIIDPDLLKKASEGLRRYAGISDAGFKKLASFGWYINGDFSLGYTTALMNKAISEDQKYIDKFFSEYYSNNINEKGKSIALHYELRSKIISEALICHNEEKYNASTILFLSQADGICGGLLFRVGKDKAALRAYISENKGGSFFATLMSSIENMTAIDTLYAELNQYDSQLNRHGVMHGWDTEFGTRINSLKAFSLLSFVADFASRYKEQ